MEYPWAPPPLQPQPAQPPPPPGYINPNIRLNSHFPNPNLLLNSQFPNPNLLLNSHDNNVNAQFNNQFQNHKQNPNFPHSQFPNNSIYQNNTVSQFHSQVQNPNFQSQLFTNQNPNFPSVGSSLHIQNPNLHVQNPNLQAQFENPNFHVQNPNLQAQFENPNFHVQNPNMLPPNQNPNLNTNLQIQNPNFELYGHQNPNFPNQNPNIQIQNPYLHNQNPNLHNQNPNLHNQNPNLHNQNPNLHNQNRNLHNQNPNLHNQNPNWHSQFPNPNLQSDFALNSNFENPNLKHQFENPNFQSHVQNPNLQAQIHQNPSLHSQFENPNLKSEIQKSEFGHVQNPNFQGPCIALEQNPNFDRNLKRPMPEGISRHIRDHGANDSILANDEFKAHFSENRMLHDSEIRRRIDEDRMLHENEIRRRIDENRMLHERELKGNLDEKSMLHEMEIRRRIDEKRMLHESEIRRHFDEKRMLHESEIRRHFDEKRMLHEREIGRPLSENSILHDREMERRFIEERMLHDREIRGNIDENRVLDDREIERRFEENRMLHEREIRGSFNENRALMLHDEEIRPNIGENRSLMLQDREIRGDFSQNSGLKRPRFDDLDMRKRYEIEKIRDDRLNGIRPENDFYRCGYEKESILETSARDRYDKKRDREEFYSKNRDRGRFENHGFPMSPEISPRKKTFFKNEKSILRDRKRPHFDDRDVVPKAPSLFPIAVDKTAPLASSYASFSDKSHVHASSGFATKELSTNHSREGQCFPLINKPKDVNATHIFKQPHRATRPDHIVVILRGLPGSGKSYLAKMMRDLEVENGGSAPRIHTMDDYFMTEVEKVEESDNLKCAGSSRGKKPAVKMVMEYCYEAEMEEAYRSSMLKTFKKTLDEGAFPFVIVDDRNLRVADFAQFWATAKRSGYEVYLLEATYKDPAGCAARNIHGFSLDDIQKMANQWEEAPPMYLKLDAKSLSQTDNLKENEIQEVDMDTDDGESEDVPCVSSERKSVVSAPVTGELLPSGGSKAEGSWNAESDHLKEEVKELGRSKWSSDLEDDDADRKVDGKGNLNSLSAIVKVYKRNGKSVHWGDQAANTGFSIGAAIRLNTSLVIGPGSGYNSKTNPLPDDLVSSGNGGTLKTQSVFKERIRAEHESFRAVFDKRRHRIEGLDSDEE